MLSSPQDIGPRVADYFREPYRGCLFIAFNDPGDLTIIRRECSRETIRLSSYCPEDGTPDIDAFRNDIYRKKGEYVILGVGEYLALTGGDAPLRILWSIYDAAKKFVVPLWNGRRALETLLAGVAYQGLANRTMFLPKSGENWKYRKYMIPAEIECDGFKAILAKLEVGFDRLIDVKTRVPLKAEWGSNVTTYGELYGVLHPRDNYPQNLLNETQWRSLLEEERAYDDDFFGVANFLALYANPGANIYLKRALEATNKQEEFKRKFIERFFEIPSDDPDFARLYAARRELMDRLDSVDFHEIVARARMIPEEKRANYLTDASEEEKKEIIKCLKNPYVTLPKDVYPQLEAYLSDYDFNMGDAELDAILNRYFKLYKRAKLANAIPEELLEIAANHDKLFFRLPTRGQLVEKFANSTSKLYWLDALGCEYLGFIAAYARKKKLAMQAWASQVKIPSITSVNRDFYDSWPYKKIMEKGLDNIKHDKTGERLNSEENKKWPLHLTEELECLNKTLDRIAAELINQKFTRVVIASDHGATRLAVIAKIDQPWEMPEKGKFGGRCCPITSLNDFRPARAVRDDTDSWLALTDYSRFKGAHQASIEVHGGASFEEIITPVIVLSLPSRAPNIVWISPRELIKPSFKDKYITAILRADLPLENPYLRLGEKLYPLELRDGNYEATIPLKETERENEAVAYAGGMELSPALRFKVERGVSQNKFDDFF